MALVASTPRVSSYFASLGELASKIVHEADGIRQSHGDKWNTMSTAQREQILDEHFVDEAVRTYYATRTAVEQQKRTSRASSGDRNLGDAGSNPSEDLPTYEMLFPRPVRTTGKFVQGGVTDESETSKGTFTYVDEFAGDFSWETKSQLEMWLPEGQKLPSPRRTRRGVKDDSEPHNVSFALQVQSEEAAADSGGVSSVRAMAQALQRSSGGAGIGAAGGGRAILSSNIAPTGGHKPAPPHRSDSISAASRADALRPSLAGAVKQSPSPAPKPATARSLSTASNASSTSDTSPQTARSGGGSGQNSLTCGPDLPNSSSTKAPASGVLSSGSNAGGSSPRPAPNPPARRDSLGKASKVAPLAGGHAKAMSTSNNAPTVSSVASEANAPSSASSTPKTVPSESKTSDSPPSTTAVRSGNVGTTSQQKPGPSLSGTTASSGEKRKDSTDIFSSLGMKSMLGTESSMAADDSTKSGFDFLDNW